MTNEEIKMLLASRLEKKASSLGDAIIDANSTLFDHTKAKKLFYGQITNPYKSYYKQLIDWWSNFTPEGIKLRKQYDAMNLHTKNPTVNTVYNIQERLKQPITDTTNIGNIASWGKMKAGDRYEEFSSQPDIVNKVKAMKALYNFSKAPEPAGLPIPYNHNIQ